MMRCTVGVFAHNEVANIRHTLQAVLTQECSQVSIVEVIVRAPLPEHVRARAVDLDFNDLVAVERKVADVRGLGERR